MRPASAVQSGRPTSTTNTVNGPAQGTSAPLEGTAPLAEQSRDAAERESVLIVEDDRAVAQLIRLYLVQAGYEVFTAWDGAEGLRLALEHQPSLVVLDLNLPEMDGVEVCRRLRAESNIPVIMVTARIEESDRLAGLDMGADDYVVKPFSPRELTARVKAVLRRTVLSAQQDGDGDVGRLEAGAIVMSLDERTVTIEGRPLTLTPTEFRLLEYFMRSEGRTFSREQLINGSLGYDFDGFDRTVDTHVSNLRRKLKSSGGYDRYVKTVYGFGYKFDPT